MSDFTFIGIDLAKRVFQLLRVSGDGSIVFSVKRSLGPGSDSDFAAILALSRRLPDFP